MPTPIPPCDPCCNSSASACNPTRVPNILPMVVTFLGTQFTVNLYVQPSTGEGPFWDSANGMTPVDVDLCPDGSAKFREFVLRCVGTSWVADFAYTIRNALGHDIQFDVTSGSGGFPFPTVVSTDPLCLTLEFAGFQNLDATCGPATLYFAIGSGCSVVPVCCGAGFPATATLAYSITGMPFGTLNLTKADDRPTYSGSRICDVGDGHTEVQLAFNVHCGPPGAAVGEWAAAFTMVRRTDGVQNSFIGWIFSTQAGTIMTSSFSASCSPYAINCQGLNTSGNISGGSSQTCLGDAYLFAVAGSISGIFSVTTP